MTADTWSTVAAARAARAMMGTLMLQAIRQIATFRRETSRDDDKLRPAVVNATIQGFYAITHDLPALNADVAGYHPPNERTVE
jgi:hypothetical protein